MLNSRQKGHKLMKEGSVIERGSIDFNEADIKLVSLVLDKTRNVYNFFKYLKKSRGLSFTIVLIKSDNLKEKILKEKRETDIFIDLERKDMNLVIIPDTKTKGHDGFTRRLMSGFKEGSGDFFSIVQIENNIDLEDAIFPLLVDYLNLLKQPLEWRTGQISFQKI